MGYLACASWNGGPSMNRLTHNWKLYFPILLRVWLVKWPLLHYSLCSFLTHFSEYLQTNTINFIQLVYNILWENDHIYEVSFENFWGNLKYFRDDTMWTLHWTKRKASLISGSFRVTSVGELSAFCPKILGRWWGPMNVICYFVNVDEVVVLLGDGGYTSNQHVVINNPFNIVILLILVAWLTI